MLTDSPTDDVTTERISAIIKQHLAERFTDEFSFGPIVPVLRINYSDPEGRDYLEIYIVFDGDQKDLDTKWTVGLPDRIRPQLAEIGFTNMIMTSMIMTSWVHCSEWDDLSEPEEI